MSVNKLLHDCTPIIFYVRELLQNQNYTGQGAIFRMQFSTVAFVCLFLKDIPPQVYYSTT